MSVESAQAFAKKFQDDANFRKSLEKAKNEKEAMGIVQSAGFDFSRSELKTVSNEGRAKLPDDVALPQSSGSWVGVGVGAVSGAAAAGVGVATAVGASSAAAAAAI